MLGHACVLRRTTSHATAALLAGALMLIQPAQPCAAAVSERDVQIAARAMGFLAHRPTGRAVLAIIYDPSDGQSVKDAEVISRTLHDGLPVGRLTVVSQLIKVSELDVLDGHKFAFLAGIPSDRLGEIYKATRSRGILSISSDNACVERGLCVMAIRSAPRVEVIVSRTASEESSVEFESAFRLMFREI